MLTKHAGKSPVDLQQAGSAGRLTTTARHYADHKARINVGLRKYLQNSPIPRNADNDNTAAGCRM